MDSKKIISKFIKPNLVAVIIFLIFPLTTIFALIALLFGTLPTINRANKYIKALEEKGELDKAAAEFISQNAKKLIKEKVVLTENYMFCKNRGIVLPYSEVLWAYKHRQTTSFLFIPINVTDSLFIATKKIKPMQVAHMGKDKKEQIKDAILEIYNHNNSCLVGYTNENVAQYKVLRKSK